MSTQDTTMPQVEALAHRIAWRYKKSSDPHHSDTYTFNSDTLRQFASAIAAQSAVKDSLTPQQAQQAQGVPVGFVRTSMLAAAPQAEPQPSHVGDSRFESWFAEYSPANKSDKQRARDAYAAGMAEPQPEREPLSRERKRAMWIDATIEACSHENCYLRGIADAEQAHGIGTKGGGK